MIYKVTNAQQEFKFNYNLKTKSGNKVYIKKSIDTITVDTIIIVSNPSTLELNNTMDNHIIRVVKDTSIIIKLNKTSTIQLEERTIGKSLKATITERNKDTLTVKFWYIDSIRNPDPYKDSVNYINSKNYDSITIYVIKNWRTYFGLKFFNYKFGYHLIKDIPFHQRQLTATSLPIRKNLDKEGNFQTDFTFNANLTYLFITGHSRLYKSSFVQPRNRFIGIGPYVGISSMDADSSKTPKKTLGLNFGGNLVLNAYNLNLVFAVGIEKGFTAYTKKTTPYFGIGIGFKLVDISTPEIKNSKD